MKENTGGPAFPRDHRHDGHNGMTLRDYFAAKAMPSLIGQWTENVRHLKQGQSLADFVASQAYAYSDAMLKAREA